MDTTSEQFEAAARDLGLGMTTEFIPYSKSRNAGSWRSLNWEATITHDDNPVLTTDYSAGEGHCPSYTQGRRSVDQDAAIRRECETGRRHRLGANGPAMTDEAIVPDFADVLASLISETDVLDFGTFEDWASEFGYDTDSRKAEANYRECLKNALALRAAIGDSALEQLREIAAEL